MKIKIVTIDSYSKNILYIYLMINIDNKVKEITKKYEKELKNFQYVHTKNIFFDTKNKYIRYVGFNNKLNYGGFFFKGEKIGNNFYIYLINKDKKVWNIDFDKNYIFMTDVLNENEKKRREFENYLLENN